MRKTLRALPVIAVMALAACGGAKTATSTRGSASGPAPATPPVSQYAPWPAAQHDATHGSAADVVGPQVGHVRWRANLHGSTTEGPVIGSDGTIYEANDAGILRAFAPATGRQLWSFDGGGAIGGDLSTSPAVLPDATIVWGGPQGKVFGLSPTGHQLWSVDVGGVPLSPVVASNSAVYVMTKSGVLVALQVAADSAAPRWSIDLGDVSYGSPVIRADGTIETTVDDSLVAVHDAGSSASVVWRFTVAKPIEVSPSVTSDGLTVLGTNDGYEYGVSAQGKQVWKAHTKGLTYSSPAVVGGKAYFGSNEGAMTVLDAASGSVERVITAPAIPGRSPDIWSAPVVDSRDDVYYGTTNGHLYGYSAQGEQLVAVVTDGQLDSYPALTSDGDLIVGSHDGYLYDIG